MFKSKKLDLLAIGDITVDAFIHITEARLVCPEHDTEHCELCLKFPDKVPFDSVKEVAGVGNSANAAVAASRLGLRSALVAHVGHDPLGLACIEALRSNNVDARYVSTERGTATNYHYALWYGDDRTILINHHDRQYAMPRISTPPKWIYLSSLASNSYPFHEQILAYIKHNPSVKLAFQPGTFQIKLGVEKLAEFYRLTEVFIVNVEEAQIILNTTDGDISALLHEIHRFGPKIVIITDGPKGAYMYDGNHVYFMPIYPDQSPPYERTGCGDAFSSTFVAALILGKTPLEALSWAPINSMSVVEYVGAQEGLLSRVELENYLKVAPPGYKPVIYNSFLEKQS